MSKRNRKKGGNGHAGVEAVEAPPATLLPVEEEASSLVASSLVTSPPPEAVSTTTPQPSEAAVVDMRIVLECFYQKHNPDKLSTIDVIMERYRGHGDQLLDHLKEKYSVSDEEITEMIGAPPGTPIRLQDTMLPLLSENNSSSSSSGQKQEEVEEEEEEGQEEEEEEGEAEEEVSKRESNSHIAPTNTAAAAKVINAPPPQPPPTTTTTTTSTSTSTAAAAVRTPPRPAASSSSSSAAAAGSLDQFAGRFFTSWTSASTTPAYGAPSSASKRNNGGGGGGGEGSLSAQAEMEQLHAALAQAKNQILALKRENTKLAADANELSSRLDVVQRNLVTVVDRESQATKTIHGLNEQLKALERSKQEVMAHLETSQRRKDNKHAQLQETILLNHRLGAQVRYLAARAFESFEVMSGDSEASEREKIMERDVGKSRGKREKASRALAHLPEVLALEARIIEAATAAAAAAAAAAASPSSVASSSTVNAANGKKSSGDEASEQDEMVVASTSSPTLPPSLSLASTVPESAEEQDYHRRIEAQNAALQKSIEVLLASYTASRIELRLAVRQTTNSEQRVAEQQLAIETLQSELKAITHELEAASGSTDTLKRQMNETSSELSRHKHLLVMAEKKLNQRDGELGECRELASSLRDSLVASEAAKADLVAICSEHTKGAESRAFECVRSLSERILFEREDIITRLSVVSELERDVRAMVSQEMQKELTRLREDLFKARRGETQKDRELSFIQRQLVEAAERLEKQEEELARRRSGTSSSNK